MFDRIAGFFSGLKERREKKLKRLEDLKVAAAGFMWRAVEEDMQELIRTLRGLEDTGLIDVLYFLEELARLGRTELSVETYFKIAFRNAIQPRALVERFERIMKENARLKREAQEADNDRETRGP